MKNDNFRALLPKSIALPYRTERNLSTRKLITSTLFLFLFLSAFISNTFASSLQQLEVVKGSVIDATTKETLPGVNVTVKGTTIGAVTNEKGEYIIKGVDSNATLVFSFIGYETVEVSVNGQSLISIELKPDVNVLDDVIVVAYGTTKRSNLTGSAVALKNEDLKDITAPNISTMIQGKVAGVYTRTGSGRPGDAASINIRGKGSLSNTNSPLWVLDGVIVGNSEPRISPSDIESITVLKDASATSLYGSLAANGVILVQTKRAEKGTSNLTANATRGYTNLSTGNFSLMNSKQLYDYQKSWNNSGWFSEDLLQSDTDWWNIGTQQGVAQEYNVNYSGGSDKMTSYLSGTYYNETGAVKGYNFERYSAIANLEFQANKRLKIKANFTGDYLNTKDQEHSLYNITTYMPWDLPYLPDGTPLHPDVLSHQEYLTSIGREWIGRDESNYLYDLQYNWGTYRSNSIRANVGFDLMITDYLTFTSTNNISMGFGNDQWYTDPRSIAGEADNGTYSHGYSFSKNRFTNQLLRFNKAIGLSNLTAFVAWEYSDTYYDDNSATGKGVAAGLNVLNTTTEPKSVSGYKGESAKQSVLVNLQYVFDSRYMATASFSRQGSSSFGPNNRYGNFWSASAGWNLHNEEFLKSISWLNQLKLAASMGQVGNAPSGFQYLGYYELTGQYNGQTAARPYQKGNPDISWEKITSYNVSLSSRFFNRVDFNIDFYSKDSKDLLAYVPLPAMTGYSGIWMNVGRIVNKGFEISVSPQIVKMKDFGWDLTFNLAYNKNEVKELYDNNPYNSGNFRREVGYDMDSYYQRIWYGVNPGNGQPLYEKVVEDADGNQSIELVSNHAEATLQHVNKKGTPSFIGGIVNSIKIYDFTVTANFGFVQGIYLYNSNRELFDSDGSYETFNNMNLAEGWSRWEKPGDIATHPKPKMGGVDANKNSTRYLEDASYIRLRNLSVSYNIPRSLSEKAKIKSASIYLSADNLLTVTKWSGMDPETGGTYPLTKKFLVGVRFNF
jgi:TonB-linked SusC/RagA family outer membrane protein